MPKKTDAPRKAFVNAVAPSTFAGVKLHPMTKQRECVAAEMGLRTGLYPFDRKHVLRDVIIFTWVLSLPVSAEKGWSVDLAEQDPEAAMKAAFTWGQARAIGIGSARLTEGYNLMMRTLKEIGEAKGEPVIPDGEEREQPPGEF